MNKNIFVAAILFVIATLCACDRNISNYAGKDNPEVQPDYTYSVEQNRNK